MERQAEHLLRPNHGLGIERLADADQMAQRRSRIAWTISSPAFINERIAVGAEYQTVTLYFLDETVPGLG